MSFRVTVSTGWCAHCMCHVNRKPWTLLGQEQFKATIFHSQDFLDQQNSGTNQPYTWLSAVIFIA